MTVQDAAEPGPAVEAPGDAGQTEDALGDRVRPYAITGGRTRAADDLPIETLVRRTVLGSLALLSARRERRDILALTDEPVSVAEVAARTGVHLGVARVLVGDLAAESLLSVYRPRLVQDRPDIAVLERVLHGLRAL